jgi:general secretion pathway protein L
MFDRYKGSFVDWIKSSLGQLFPARDLRRMVAWRATSEIAVNREGAALYRRQSLLRPIADDLRVAKAATIAEVKTALKPKESFLLSFAPDVCFASSVQIPVRGLHNTDRIIDSETSRITPFNRNAIMTFWSNPSNESDEAALVEFAVLKTDAVPPELLMDKRLVAIGLRPNEGSVWPRLLEPDGNAYGSRTEKKWQRLAGASLLLLASGSGAFVGLEHMRLNRERASLQETIVPLEEKVKEIQDRINLARAENQRLDTVLTKRNKTPTALSVWQELTVLLPDSAWIQSLSSGEGNIQIDGFADNAETLIGTIEASSLFRNARFSAPVFKNPGEIKQRFSITMELEN